MNSQEQDKQYESRVRHDAGFKSLGAATQTDQPVLVLRWKRELIKQIQAYLS